MSIDLLPAALRQPAIGDGSFPAGTPIAVPSGDGAPTEVAVESLVRGDRVLTLAGPVAVRHVTTIRIEPPASGPDAPPRPRLIPVRVEAGAFGEGQPVADLVLPPEQMVHVLDAALPQGALVPLGALVNGMTIRREVTQVAATWVRLELERPGVVIASGLLVAARHDPSAAPAAAFLPPGPATAALRARLAARVEAVAAKPAAAGDGEVAQIIAAAPRGEAVPDLVLPDSILPGSVQTGDAIDEIAAPVEAPAAVGAKSPVVADAPALRVMVQGEALALLEGSAGGAWHYWLPEGAMVARLMSPRGLPANTASSERGQARRFGVAVRAILLDDVKLPLDGPAIGDGFHNIETAGSESWRWTNGEAVVHLPPSGARRRLTVLITDWHRMLQPE